MFSRAVIMVRTPRLIAVMIKKLSSRLVLFFDVRAERYERYKDRRLDPGSILVQPPAKSYSNEYITGEGQCRLGVGGSLNALLGMSYMTAKIQ
jgi:hypothetical protein